MARNDTCLEKGKTQQQLEKQGIILIGKNIKGYTFRLKTPPPF